MALINGQMLLVEGGRKRLDDVVDDLQTEIVSLRQQLEEAEKKYVFVCLSFIVAQYRTIFPTKAHKTRYYKTSF